MLATPITHGAACPRSSDGRRAHACRSSAMLVDTLDCSLSTRSDFTNESTDSGSRLPQIAGHVERALPKGWAVLAASVDSESVGRAVEAAMDHGSDRLVVVPLQPHFARASTGRLLDLMYHALADLAPDLHVEVRTSWYDDVDYIAAIADTVHATIERDGLDADACRVLVVPSPTVGLDPIHSDQCEQTARLVAHRLEWPENRVGVFDESARLAHDWHSELETPDPAAGHVIAVPAGLVWSTPGDEQRLAECLPRPGFTIHWCDTGEASERLVKTLGTIVRRGRHAAPSERPPRRSAVAPNPKEIVGELFGVGVSIPGAVRSEHDADDRCSGEDFLAIKRPHLEALALLRDARAELSLPECWLFNTCHRFELYGWFPAGTDEAARAALVQAMARIVGRDRAAATRVRRGTDAWRHLLRTAAGLNSGLVGDADVTEQLESGLRAAQYAGTAGTRSVALIDRAIAGVRRVRGETSWGRYTHRYSEAALVHLPEDVQKVFARGRITVMGGSTTAVSLLEVLRGRYGVQPEQITVVYRGNRSGPLMNRFLAAVGEARMRKVEDYQDDRVLRDVAQADAAFLAADHREPVFSGPQVAAIRDASAAPLVVVDFNSFGSIRDAAHPCLRLFDADTIARTIEAFNDRTRSCPEFPAALAQAEEWIARHSTPHHSIHGEPLTGVPA